ncbi:hypothetical protein SDC9_164619 [bioreactor metagenome]|uniref:Uncharacterized protein n=1 Tax=bioreactor metagenome TaxID=1076179 RepID=A0A645FU33_9ZZZZ
MVRTVEATLRQPPEERRLAAFEERTNRGTGTGLLPLFTPAAGLAHAGAVAPAHALPALRRARSRTDFMQFHNAKLSR